MGTVDYPPVPPHTHDPSWDALVDQVRQPNAEHLLVRAQVAAALFPEQHDPATVDRYVLLHRVGAGAMGVVYAAYDPKLDRKIALKLLHGSDHDPARAQQRLTREARALAKLSDPHVVAIHDAGTAHLVDASGTRRSVVYIAMEFVDGEPLAAWLQRSQKSWQERLAVFVQAGHGLAAAHRVGLVHRDFKADNVLIDEAGRIKVTDFGLARAHEGPSRSSDRAGTTSSVDTEGASATNPVTTYAAAGTPAYMAPEQIAGETVDALADQFSFCVALWEALYGQRPFAGERVDDLFASIVAGNVTEPTASASVPGWLRAAIVRGLAAAPENRYPTMELLLAALSNDPSRRRRRRMWASITASALVSSLVGFGVYRQQRRTACQFAGGVIHEVWNGAAHRELADTFRATGLDYATTAFEKSRERLDGYAERWSSARTDACLAENRGVENAAIRRSCLDAHLDSFTRLLDELRIGDTRAVASAVTAAARIPPVDTCADPLRARHYADVVSGASDERRFASWARRLRAVEAMSMVGRVTDARDEAVKLRTDIEADDRPDDELLARAFYLEGSAQDLAGNAMASKDALESAYELASRMGDEHRMAQSAAALANVVGDRLGKSDQGLIWAKVAASLLQATHSVEDDPVMVAAVAGMGNTHQRMAEYDVAVNEHRRAVGLAESAYGPTHPLTAGLVMTLANSMDAAGDHRGAVETHQKAIAIYEEALGPEHPDVARALNNLGNAYDALSNYQAALQAYERSLRIRNGALPPDHPSIASVLSNLGNTHRSLGHHDQALALHLRALEIRRKAYGDDHFDVAASHGNLGLLYQVLGQPGTAIEHDLAALTAFEKLTGPDSPPVAAALTNLGVAEADLGLLGQAMTHQQRALEIGEATLGSDHSSLISPLYQLGQLHGSRHEFVRAQDYFSRALDLCRRALGDNNPREATIRIAAARALLAEHRHQAATGMIEPALSLRESADVSAALLGEANLVSAMATKPEAPQRAQALALTARDLLTRAGPPGRQLLGELERWTNEISKNRTTGLTPLTR